MSKCGDRVVLPLDYAGIVHALDYPCKLDLPSDRIHAAAEALRSREGLVAALQLRFADIGTDLLNLDQYNPSLLQDLRDVSGRGK